MSRKKATPQRLGERLRELRGSRATQEELARVARATGLFDWRGNTVALIESGKRNLTAEELLMLPMLLGMALDEPVEGLLAFLGPCGLKRADGSVIETDLLEVAVLGSEQTMTVERKVAPGHGHEMSAPGNAFDEVIFTTDDLPEADKKRHDLNFLRISPELSLKDLNASVHEWALDAEQKAARKFGVLPVVVTVGAHKLWGKGLTNEREERLSSIVGEADSQRTKQARRGAVTRQLLKELDAYLDERGVLRG